jgi:hypothetical protein
MCCATLTLSSNVFMVEHTSCTSCLFTSSLPSYQQPPLPLSFPPLSPPSLHCHGRSFPHWLARSAFKRLWRFIHRKSFNRHVCWRNLVELIIFYTVAHEETLYLPLAALVFHAHDRPLPILPVCIMLTTQQGVSGLLRCSRCDILMYSVETHCQLGR